MVHKAKYDKLGIRYNNTRTADPYLLSRLVFHLKLSARKQYADIGCGSGNYTRKLSEINGHWIGVDPSEHMLGLAQRVPSGVNWRMDTAENTGLDLASIDGLVGFLTIHHWSNLNLAFLELSRILKPEGIIVLFTSSPKQMKRYWLNHYFPYMMSMSIEQMPSVESIKNIMESTGLVIDLEEIYNIDPDLKDHFLYCGKDHPSLYLNEDIRNGISSFSSLGHIDEKEKGLRDLDQDIKTGYVNEIKHTYKHDMGDYLFIVGHKVD